MQSLKSYLSRRKFTVLGLGMLSSVAVFRFWSFSKEADKSKTVKMLAQDGTLVEVDASLLSSNKRKVSKDEILNWIKK